MCVWGGRSGREIEKKSGRHESARGYARIFFGAEIRDILKANPHNHAAGARKSQRLNSNWDTLARIGLTWDSLPQLLKCLFSPRHHFCVCPLLARRYFPPESIYEAANGADYYISFQPAFVGSGGFGGPGKKMEGK